MTKDGKERDFSVLADGEFLGFDVRLEDVPAAVRKTLLAEADNAKLGDITQTTDDDGVYYDAEITDATGTRTVSVTADGEIDSTERTIALSAAPEAVQSAVKDFGGTLVEISKVIEDNDVTYDIEIRKAGTKQELTLKPDGKSAEP